tara:strand:+ start:1850 stop:2170 length:321 start_codon:yes stop_codon:yes gene_type:complete
MECKIKNSKMKKYTITTANFLEWYFNEGSDQEQEIMRIDFANTMIDQLQESGRLLIKASELFEEVANVEQIPLYLIEEFKGRLDMEYEHCYQLSDLDDEYILKLIK